MTGRTTRSSSRWYEGGVLKRGRQGRYTTRGRGSIETDETKELTKSSDGSKRNCLRRRGW